MLANRETLHILKNKITGVQFANDPHEFYDKGVTPVLKRAVSNRGEPLAGRSAHYDVDFSLSQVGSRPDCCAGELRNVATQSCAVWKIEFVRSRMHGIDFHSCNYVEPGLFKAE